MLIERIEYENFRNFKNAGAVDCSTDGKVTIIYGENGAGKTTFHQLFQWIIYGKVHFNKTASDKMYNLEFERKAPIDEEFSVKGAIDFKHLDEDYTIRREWIYKKTIYETKRIATSFTVSKKDANRNWVRLPNPEDVVEQLLPSGLADYFFFDGESMITDLKAKGKDSANSLRDALYLMLDLSVYDKAVKYIGQQDRTTTTLGTLFMSQTGTSSNANLVTLGQQMEQAQMVRDRQEGEERKLDEQIGCLEERIKEISEQIGSAKSQREYESMRTQAKNVRDNYLALEEREYQGFGEELISVFPKLMISKVVEKAGTIIKRQGENPNVPNGVNVALIDALLKSDVCICGTPLTEKERAVLRKMYNYLPPHYESVYQNFINTAKQWGREYNRQKLEGYIDRALSDAESARKQDDRIADIDNRMKQDKQYEDLVVERKKAEEDLRECNENKRRVHEEAYKYRLRVNKLKRDIDKLSGTLTENALIKRKIDIMEAVKAHFVEILHEKSVSYSQKLQETIQELLDKMLKAKRTVNVSTDFSLRVADSYDDESKSEGQFATVSFAYIGGIFKLLSEEKILKNKEYPLVLDAPFSKLGDEPRQRVIDTIPQYAPQIILLSKDNLQNDFNNDMLGKVWTIVSNEEQNVAEIKEGFLWK